MSKNTDSNLKEKILNKYYSGGIQQYFPRNEAHVYKNNFTIDVASYCLTDFSSSSLSYSEADCVKRLSKLNSQLIDSL